MPNGQGASEKGYDPAGDRDRPLLRIWLDSATKFDVRRATGRQGRGPHPGPGRDALRDIEAASRHPRFLIRPIGLNCAFSVSAHATYWFTCGSLESRGFVPIPA